MSTRDTRAQGFTRGVATNWGGAWTELDLTGLPDRFPNNVTFDPSDPTNSTIFLVFNGFNRRFIEGPGAGTKHVYRGKLSKAADGNTAQRSVGRGRAWGAPGPTASAGSRARLSGAGAVPAGVPTF